ncbi:MAG: RNA methyltransferase [Bacilli bacterium]|nr:RNA methyltransferase [Bacilli bacterium]
MVITSLENEKIKNYAKLKDKKYRDITNTFIVEGFHLVQEAFKKGIIIEILSLEDVFVPFDSPITIVSEEVMKKITMLDTSVDIIAICNKITPNLNYGNKILMLDQIQDPGNLGTIIRSAKAFDIDTILISNGTVDLYNSKVLRSTQGTMFHINIVIVDLLEEINKLKEKNVPILVTNVLYGEDVRKLDDNTKNKFALVMGNEGKGVREEIMKLADKKIFIDMNSDVESLNVGVATSILLYELNRR